jgi:superfamily II DNA/RNA helicase
MIPETDHLALFTRRAQPASSDSIESDSTNEETTERSERVDELASLVTFASLGVADDLAKVLADGGITSPFPVQEMTIPDALAGRDVCGKAKTGSGKTLAFGLPLVQGLKRARSRHPRALVLVPTRELANQVGDELAPLAAARGMWLTTVYGGVSMGRQIRALREGVELVVATPGRLNDLLERGELKLTDINLVVLDEADQMADMGFLPQVERILQQVEGQPQTLLFSATLDGAIGTLIRKYQDNPVQHEVHSDTATVNTLEQRFIGVSRDTKPEVAARLCGAANRAIVFVRTTHGADRVARQMEQLGLKAAPIHGRLSQNKRERTLADFARGLAPVLVATNVAARGLHVDGVDLVIHFDPPEDHKVYLHRSGRTARAGEQGMVVTLVQPEEQRDIASIQRAAGIDLAIVTMTPDDPRLGDLAAWEPPKGAPMVPPRGMRNDSGSRPTRSGGRGGPRTGGAPRGSGSRNGSPVASRGDRSSRFEGGQPEGGSAPRRRSSGGGSGRPQGGRAPRRF